MLSMAGVSSRGVASLGCERVGILTGLCPILFSGSALQFAQVAGAHELIIITLTFSLVWEVWTVNLIVLDVASR